MTSANTGAMLYQLSYEATLWEQGFFFPVDEFGKFTAMIIVHFHLETAVQISIIFIIHISLCLALLTKVVDFVSFPRNARRFRALFYRIRSPVEMIEINTQKRTIPLLSNRLI